MNKIKRRLAAAFLLLMTVLYVTGLTAALCEPADPDEGANDPYDWSNYEGEVILDDPEFFMFDEETLDENKPMPETGEDQQAGDSSEEGTGEQPAELPEEFPAGNPSQEDPTPSDDEQGEEPAQATNAPVSPTENPTVQPEQPADLKSLFLVEIKVPAGWFNLPEKAVRLKITPKSEALWDKIFCRLDNGEWMEIKDRFSFQDGYYYLDLTVTANGSMSVRLMDAAGDYFDTQKEIRIFDHRPPEVTAGIKNTMLHVVAVDDLSEVAGIQVNGLLFTTLEDGVLDVRMEKL